MSKTLIAYQTLYSSTKQAANTIAKTLRNNFNLKVDVFDIGKGKASLDLDDYDSVVIGSCIFDGRWASNAENFLRNDFDGKQIALFVCSGYAGEADLYPQAYNAYLETLLEKHKKIKPVSMEAFGGRVPETKFPEVWSMQVQKKLSKFQKDNRSMGRIINWAQELGRIFTDGKAN